MSLKNNDVKYLNWNQYISLVEQGKIVIKHQKTAQELEAERLINQCVAAVEKGEKFS